MFFRTLNDIPARHRLRRGLRVLLLVALLGQGAPISLDAQAPGLPSAKQFKSQDLQPYINNAAGKQTQQEWLQTVQGGLQVLSLNWEQDVSTEIDHLVSLETRSDSVLGSQPYKDTTRAELELIRSQARSDWSRAAQNFLENEMTSFLNSLADAKANEVQNDKVNRLNAIDPTVQSYQNNPNASLGPADQAASQYYDGRRIWDDKRGFLNSQRAAWEQDSVQKIQSGLFEWDLGISSLQQGRADALAEINRMERTWQTNGDRMAAYEQQLRTSIQGMVTNLRSSYTQSVAGDAALDSSFGDLNQMLDTVQDALKNKAPLSVIAGQMSGFFTAQQDYARLKKEYWADPARLHETRTVTESVTFNRVVGTNAYTGSMAFEIQGRPVSWRTNAQLSGVDNITFSDSGQVEFKQMRARTFPVGGWEPDSYTDTRTGNYNNREITRTEETSWNTKCTYVNQHGNCAAYYTSRWRLKQVDSLTFNSAQIQANKLIYDALGGLRGAEYSGSEKIVKLEENVVRSGTTRINSLAGIGTGNQNILIQSRYTVENATAGGNRDTWATLENEYSTLAASWLAMINPLNTWAAKLVNYNSNRKDALAELSKLKANVNSQYDVQIDSMTSRRDAWLNKTYGRVIPGYSGTVYNSSSEYNAGMAEWDKKGADFSSAERTWLNQARSALKDALENPTSGEETFIQTTESLVGNIKADIQTSESVSQSLEDKARAEWGAYQGDDRFSSALKLINTVINSKQNERLLNDRGQQLSVSLRDAHIRSGVYRMAELDSINRLNSLGGSINTTSTQAAITAHAGRKTLWDEHVSGVRFGFQNRDVAAAQKLVSLQDIQQELGGTANTFHVDIKQRRAELQASLLKNQKRMARYQKNAGRSAASGDLNTRAYYGHKMSKLSRRMGRESLNVANQLAGFIASEKPGRSLQHTSGAFESYRQSLLNKGFAALRQADKTGRGFATEARVLVTQATARDSVEDLLQTARALSGRGAEYSQQAKVQLKQAEDLAKAQLDNEILAGLEGRIAGLFDDLPSDISPQSDGLESFYESQRELTVINDRFAAAQRVFDDSSISVQELGTLQNLEASMQQSLGFAANTSLYRSMDALSVRVGLWVKKQNELNRGRVLAEIKNSQQFQYLRDAGYSFRSDGDLVIGTRDIKNGDFGLGGDSRNKSAYAARFTAQYITVNTEFSGGVSLKGLDVGQLAQNNFSTGLVDSIRDYQKTVEENVHAAFAQFQDKRGELKVLHTENEREREAREQEFETNSNGRREVFAGIEKDFSAGIAQNLKSTVAGIAGIDTGSDETRAAAEFQRIVSSANSSFISALNRATEKDRSAGYRFSETFGENGPMLVGTRKLSGTVNVPVAGVPLPLSVEYADQSVEISLGFDISDLEFDYQLKFQDNGLQNSGEVLEALGLKYEELLNRRMVAVQKLFENNTREAEQQGFLFSALSGTTDGTSFKDSLDQASMNYRDSMVAGSIADSLGLPKGLVSAFMGSKDLTKAMEAYAMDEIAAGVDEITGHSGSGAWLRGTVNAAEGRRKEREGRRFQSKDLTTAGLGFLWRNAQYSPDGQMALNVIETGAAVAVNIVLPGLGAGITAGYYSAKQAYLGAQEGGTKGALAGAASGAATAVTSKIGLSVSLSYDYDDGWGGSLGLSVPGTGSVSAGLHVNYQEGQGVTGGGLDLGYGGKSGLGGSLRLNVGADGKFSSGAISGTYTKGLSSGGNIKGKAGLNFTRGGIKGVTASGSYGEKHEWGDGTVQEWRAGGGVTVNRDGTFGLNLSNSSGYGNKYRFGFNRVDSNVDSVFTFNSSGKILTADESISITAGYQTRAEAKEALAQKERDLRALQAQGLLSSADVAAAMKEVEKLVHAATPELALGKHVLKELQSFKDNPEVMARLGDDAKTLLENPDALNNKDLLSDPAFVEELKALSHKIQATRDDLGLYVAGSGQSAGNKNILQRIGNSIKGGVGSLFGYSSDLDKNGNWVQKTCFVAGTPVLTSSGYRPVESIKAGDYVLSWNENTGRINRSLVQETYVRQAPKIYELKYSDGTIIRTTWSHRFYVSGKGWVKARDMVAGDVSLSYDDATHSASLERELLSVAVEPESQTVYNFSVADNHSYFVSHANVLVHNEAYPMSGFHGGLDVLRADHDTAVKGLKRKFGSKYKGKSEAWWKLKATQYMTLRSKAYQARFKQYVGGDGKVVEGTDFEFTDEAIRDGVNQADIMAGGTAAGVAVYGGILAAPVVAPVVGTAAKGMFNGLILKASALFGTSGLAPVIFRATQGNPGRVTQAAQQTVSRITQLAKPSSYKLGQNLVKAGFKRPAGAHAHHIVASGEKRYQFVEKSRQILADSGININSAINGVFLPGTKPQLFSGAYHPSLHTEVYHKTVYNLLYAARNNPKRIEQTLNYIREQLTLNKFPR